MEVQSVQTFPLKSDSQHTRGALGTGLGTAFIAGTIGAAAGALKNPDIFEYAQTAAHLNKAQAYIDVYRLKRIAKKLDKDPKVKLSESQKELLKEYNLEGKTGRQIFNEVRKALRPDKTTSIIKRADNEIVKSSKIIKDLQDVNTKLENVLKKHKPVLTVLDEKGKTSKKTFKSKKEALAFFENRRAKAVSTKIKFQKLQTKLNKAALNNGFGIVNSFKQKNNNFRKEVIALFKNTKAVKYGAVGAFVAGIAAFLTSLAHRDQKVIIKVPKEVKIPVPVPVPVIVPAGKNTAQKCPPCPECKPCEKPVESKKEQKNVQKETVDLLKKELEKEINELSEVNA